MRSTHAGRKGLGTGARAALLAALATGAAALATAPAQASSRASCRFEAHVSFSPPIGASPSRGTLSQTERGSAQCKGTLDDATVDGEGGFNVGGQYGSPPQWPVVEGDNCSLGIGSTTFEAWAPKLLAFFAPQDVRLSGTIAYQRAGSVMTLSGRGYAGRDRVDYGGVAQFVADPGQDCLGSPMYSGRLIQQVTISDGSWSENSAQQSSSADSGAEPQPAASPKPTKAKRSSTKKRARKCRGRGKRRHCTSVAGKKRSKRARGR
jgi:hypothetical protein